MKTVNFLGFDPYFPWLKLTLDMSLMGKKKLFLGFETKCVMFQSVLICIPACTTGGEFRTSTWVISEVDALEAEGYGAT